jgi:dynein heavy chain
VKRRRLKDSDNIQPGWRVETRRLTPAVYSAIIAIFVDDLNMPMLDIFGAPPPVELLGQWMDSRGWYDRKNVGKLMEIVDVAIVAAIGPPSSGRNPVTLRFTRHFNLVSFVEMEDDSLQQIFSTILE